MPKIRCCVYKPVASTAAHEYTIQDHILQKLARSIAIKLKAVLNSGSCRSVSCDKNGWTHACLLARFLGVANRMSENRLDTATASFCQLVIVPTEISSTSLVLQNAPAAGHFCFPRPAHSTASCFPRPAHSTASCNLSLRNLCTVRTPELSGASCLSRVLQRSRCRLGDLSLVHSQADWTTKENAESELPEEPARLQAEESPRR